jgi:acyl carrier protein
MSGFMSSPFARGAAVHDREAVYRMLREWIHTANPAAGALGVGPATDLIGSGILESLQVVELVLFLERRTGREILAEHLNPDSFRTLNSIFRNFFEADA